MEPLATGLSAEEYKEVLAQMHTNAGLEKAAKWHDDKSEDCKELHALHIEAGRELLARTALELASFHEDAAKAIRELKT